MEPFNNTAPCRKCGGTTRNVQFVEQRIKHLNRPDEQQEYLTVECRTCGYVHRAKPLDAAA